MNLSNNQNLRSAFKEGLSKLIEIDTRTQVTLFLWQALKELQVLIVQNKTTNSLRVWLSVLSENRTKHS